ncbi:MAG: FtsX-like permease family protein [Bacteroidetes bacterium]|nr:MAG: FtsX-like permease family protein [Bacteroidota bacterium]
MLRNYLTTAWRTLLRYRSYALLNILGLSLGIGCSILVFMMVKFQSSFDTWHSKAERTYRIVTEFHFDGISYTPGVPNPLTEAVRQDFSFVERAGFCIGQNNRMVAVLDDLSRAQKKFREEQTLCFVEPDYFHILDYTWIEGNPEVSLRDPQQVVLTRHMAEKYFGKEKALGRRLRMDNELELTVSGIVEDIPENTDRKHELFISFSTLKNYRHGGPRLDHWGGINSDSHCFVLLKEGVSPQQLRDALPDFRKKYHGDKGWQVYDYQVIPIADMHFETDYEGRIDRSQLRTLSLIGLFLLLTACINFVNMATAQAGKRAREIGIRKVLGSSQGQLFWQFIAETAVITLISLFIGLGLAKLGAPLINQLFETELPFEVWRDGQLWLFMLLLFAGVVFISGSYPALILAGFRPIVALKGTLKSGTTGGMQLRRALVVLQFAISQLMIIGTVIITQQVQYLRQKDIGYNPSAIALVSIPTPEKTAIETLRNRFAQVPGVEKVSFCQFAPTSGSNNTTNHAFDSRTEDEKWQVNTKPIDKNYLETFGLKLIAGTKLPESDTMNGYIVNEAYVNKLGLKAEDVIGKNATIYGLPRPIYGVVADWNNLSLHNEIDPVVMFNDKGNQSLCALKMSTQNVSQSLKGIEGIWNETFPEYLYEQTFLDERIAEFYESEKITLNLIGAFAAIAILIGCLGLYGLVSFMALSKTKEVGVRKVLGARNQQILMIFIREFGILMLIAFVIAAPLSWWAMNAWLQDYNYRISIGAGVYLLAIFITAFIAAVTVSYESLKAANANPVKSLKIE